MWTCSYFSLKICVVHIANDIIKIWLYIILCLNFIWSDVSDTNVQFLGRVMMQIQTFIDNVVPLRSSFHAG